MNATPEELKEVWERSKRFLSFAEQERVIARVKEGWPFEKAVHNEGHMTLQTSVDLYGMREMFETGELVASSPPREKAKPPEPKEEDSSNFLKPGYERKEGFVPRPKSPKPNP